MKRQTTQLQVLLIASYIQGESATTKMPCTTLSLRSSAPSHTNTRAFCRSLWRFKLKLWARWTDVWKYAGPSQSRLAAVGIVHPSAYIIRVCQGLEPRYADGTRHFVVIFLSKNTRQLSHLVSVYSSFFPFVASVGEERLLFSSGQDLSLLEKLSSYMYIFTQNSRYSLPFCRKCFTILDSSIARSPQPHIHFLRLSPDRPPALF